MSKKNPFPTFYQEFIYKGHYARWLDDEGRRENWDETINRYLDFFDKKVSTDYPQAHADYTKIRPELFNAIYNLEVMPSMRALMVAGKALEKNNIAAFNCAFTPIDHPRAFDEILLILMSGTGVGFSVERQFIAKLPVISEEFHDTDTTIVVHDSRIGWAKAFRELLGLLWIGQVPKYDVSKLRPSGARLKTFGGRSSGPDPLVDLFQFVTHTFKNAAGRKLTSIECHDIVCKTGDVVVVGGVRRSALASLSNLSDDRMRAAKNGQWWVDFPYRRLANNSAVYDEKPEFSVFLKEWTSLYESKAGERGIYSRVAAQKSAARNGRRKAELVSGTNPCHEISMRNQGFCNLSEVVIRENDDAASLKRKIKLATVLGTLQSTLTDFPYLRKAWKDNAEEERLLGVSMTGILDSAKDLLTSEFLVDLKDHAISINKKWAEKLGIPQSVAITTVKPSGTVSQLVDSASGIHPRFSEYYVRTVRCDKKDPLGLFMLSKGFPCEDDVTNSSTWVFSFPMKSPEGAVLASNMGAMEQLKLWEKYSEHWAEHKVSQTVYYKDSEFLSIGQWIFNHLDTVGGISFLPLSDHVYKQAPYQAIDKTTYEKLLSEMPKDIDWNELASFEKEDNTTGSHEFACAGGACEVVDIAK